MLNELQQTFLTLARPAAVGGATILLPALRDSLTVAGRELRRRIVAGLPVPEVRPAWLGATLAEKDRRRFFCTREPDQGIIGSGNRGMNFGELVNFMHIDQDCHERWRPWTGRDPRPSLTGVLSSLDDFRDRHLFMEASVTWLPTLGGETTQPLQLTHWSAGGRAWNRDSVEFVSDWAPKRLDPIVYAMAIARQAAEACGILARLDDPNGAGEPISWGDCTPLQRDIIRHFLDHPAGYSISRTNLFQSVHGMHFKGAHATLLLALLEPLTGVLFRKSSHAEISLIRLPRNLPRQVSRHADWTSTD